MGTRADQVRQRLQAKKRAFLDAYVEHGTVYHAAKAVGIHRTTHYRWLEADPEYAAAFAQAEEDAIQVLEREARRRAVEGVEEPVGWHKGRPGGYVRRYSDTLLIFLLKSKRPDVYRDQVEHVGKGGGPIQLQGSILAGMSPEEIRRLAEEPLE